MAGRADLDPNILVDGLVPDIDDLRDELHAEFGVRPFSVFVVRRIWQGDAIGDGAYDDRETELIPRPRVMNLPAYQLMPGGLSEQGEIKVTEVSLSYAYEELCGSDLAPNEQWLIRLDEANGQGQPSRYFTHAKPPFPDREKDMGWVLYLRAFNNPGC